MDALDAIPESAARHLLGLARESIHARLERRPSPQPTLSDTVLFRQGGAFVTLKKRGTLRGCIGRIESDDPLWETVVAMAKAAAFDDPRFPALGPDELDEIDIEISVMSPLRAVGSPDEVVAGEHGVMLALGGRRAVFLPQVAAEQGWSRETLLEQLALKAGLPGDAWRDPAARIDVFRAVVIEE